MQNSQCQSTLLAATLSIFVLSWAIFIERVAASNGDKWDHFAESVGIQMKTVHWTLFASSRE